MTASSSNSVPTVGFLTVIAYAEKGLVGGYLVLNFSARPLEFHCTAPVRPNRAQKILYGPTLKPYLYGEQIGRTLLDRAKCKPLMVCTDVPEALVARDFASYPVMYVCRAGDDADQSTNDADGPRENHAGTSNIRFDGPHTAPSFPTSMGLVSFTLGSHRVAVSEEYREDEATVTQHWQRHATGFDLCEPFRRIHEALQEAQGS